MDGQSAAGSRGGGLAVAAGGGIGAVARFGLAGWMVTGGYGGLPWGTFAVNALGSLALGALSGVLARRGASPALRAFLLTGLCGGFTTFSAFDYEVLSLLQRGEHAIAAAYALASVGTCILGVAVGSRLTLRVPR